MAIKCLMLETKDKRQFFTFIRNKAQLGEYCRTFGAKTMIVKADLKKNNVLDLPKLVAALCDKNYKATKVEFSVLKR